MMMAKTPTLEELEGIYGRNYRGFRGPWNEKGQILEFVIEVYVGGRGFGGFANDIEVAGKMMKDAGFTEACINFYEPNMTIQITAWRDETDEEQEKRLALKNGE